VTVTDDTEGVIYATGSRFGGHSLFIKDRKLFWYVNNFIGIPPAQQLISPEALTAGDHVLGAEFVKASMGEHHETLGTAKLWRTTRALQRGT
jgi:arylsulfatase